MVGRLAPIVLCSCVFSKMVPHPLFYVMHTDLTLTCRRSTQAVQQGTTAHPTPLVAQLCVARHSTLLPHTLLLSTHHV
jgi:hypothetical protein